jgi:hypothetical protein
MTASISSQMNWAGTFECYIRVDNEDGRYYFMQKSVPSETATEENIEIWKSQAILLAQDFWQENI